MSRQRGLVTTVGRLIPVKTAKAAKLIHHLLVTEAPAWVLGAMEKWGRAFFWAGTDEINGGKCLVAWSKVVPPTCCGGLGIENPKLQGLALRVRWEWLRCTDPGKPWQGLQIFGDISARLVFQ